MYNTYPFGSCQSSYPTVFRGDYRRVVPALLTLVIYHLVVPNSISPLCGLDGPSERKTHPSVFARPGAISASNCSWPRTLFSMVRRARMFLISTMVFSLSIYEFAKISYYLLQWVRSLPNSSLSLSTSSANSACKDFLNSGFMGGLGSYIVLYLLSASIKA